MPIPFTCPHCGATTDVADQSAGHSDSCVRCGKTVDIPPSQAEPPPTAPAIAPKRGVGLGCLVFVVLLVCGGAIIALLLLAEARSHEAARQACCINNLKQIGLAMQAYHEKHGCFPPAFIPDENGKPKHSWRVLLLPFMDDKLLHEQYRFDEPWNGPHNIALAALTNLDYCCPSDPTPPKPGTTNYVMLVGPHAISDGPTARRKADITDGLDKTIMVVEVVGPGINWAEPRDLEVDKMTFHIVHRGNESTTNITGISSGHPSVANVLMCDGTVRSLPNDIDPKTLEALTTIDGGETVNLDDH